MARHALNLDHAALQRTRLSLSLLAPHPFCDIVPRRVGGVVIAAEVGDCPHRPWLLAGASERRQISLKVELSQVGQSSAPDVVGCDQLGRALI
eukprot:1016444-Prymnesium_polylepis.1